MAAAEVDGGGNGGAGDGSDSGAGGNVGDNGDGNGGDSAGSSGGDVLDGNSGEDHCEEETVKTPTDPRTVPGATKAKKTLVSGPSLSLSYAKTCEVQHSPGQGLPAPLVLRWDLKEPTHQMSCPVLNFMSLPQLRSDPLPRSSPLSLLSFKNAKLRHVEAKASPLPTHQKAKPPCLALCLLLLPLSCRLPLPVRIFSGVTMAKTTYRCPSKRSHKDMYPHPPGKAPQTVYGPKKALYPGIPVIR